MSNTPRTDAKESESVNCELNTHLHYGWKFARQLETELAEARQQLVERDALVERMREALSELVACRQLKKDAARVASSKITSNSMEHIDRLWASHDKRDPIAWETATNILAALPSSALSEHDVEVRRKALNEAADILEFDEFHDPAKGYAETELRRMAKGE